MSRHLQLVYTALLKDHDRVAECIKTYYIGKHCYRLWFEKAKVNIILDYERRTIEELCK